MRSLRDDVFEEKVDEVQKMLIVWADATGILAPGEQIKFSMYIDGVPTVVQEEDKHPNAMEQMHPEQFFAHDRLLEAGATPGIVSRILNSVRIECMPWGGEPAITTMQEFLKKRNSDVASLMRTPNLGRKSVLPMVKLILEAGLSIDGGEAFVDRWTRK